MGAVAATIVSFLKSPVVKFLVIQGIELAILSIFGAVAKEMRKAKNNPEFRQGLGYMRKLLGNTK